MLDLSRSSENHRRLRRISAALLGSVLAPLTLAQVSAQEGLSPNVELPTIVVSPTGVATPIDQVASSVTVITADEIQTRQQRTVPEVLATVPGLNVVQTGNAGGTTSVFTRGTNSNHTKILIDGIDLSDPSTANSAPDLAHLLTGDVERIEVLRGPQSGLYGSDAIGGVISITTKKGQGPAKVTAKLEGGSFGTFNQSAGLSGSVDKFNYVFDVQHFRQTSAPSVPDRWAATAPYGVANGFYDNKTVSSRLGYDFNELVSVNWTGRYIDGDYRYPADVYDAFYNPFVSPFQSTQISKQLFTRGEAVVTAPGDLFKSYVGVNYSNQYRWYNQPQSATNPFDVSTYDYVGEKLKYDWRSVVPFMAGQTLVVGADYTQDRYTQLPEEYTVSYKGIYAELQQAFAERFFLVSNIRHDEHETFGGINTYRIAPAVLLPVLGTKLKASYGTGFKAPSLFQLYSPQYGNTGLQPEESTGWDAGFEQPVFNDRVRFGATYFHNDLTNLIEYKQTGIYTGQYYNVAQAETEGVEAFVDWRVYSRLNLRGDYTYTKAINSTTGEDLLRRPRNKASVTAKWTPTDPLTVSATVLYVGSWYDTYDRNEYAGYTQVSGYTVVNLAAEYKYEENLVFFGRIDNLFDKQYEVPWGYQRTGIGVFGGVRIAMQDGQWPLQGLWSAQARQ